MRVVITGSSRGIGRALTERLLAHGHQVWGLARSDQSALAAKHAAAFRATRCDVSDWTKFSAAVREILLAWPEVDGLITCAGIQGAIGRATTLDPLQWSAAVRANLDGTYYAIRAFFGALQHASRRAKIVCFSGGGASRARPNFSAYGAAKTAVVRMVETIAEEERSTALDINAVAPGAVGTRMIDEIIAAGAAVAGETEYQAALRHKEADGNSMDRALDLVEWLLSPASDGISGRLISAVWDSWSTLDRHRDALTGSDIYHLRRITPEERGQKWS